MLLPCGVGIFSGVEFVCCPKPIIPTTERIQPIIDNHLDSKQPLTDQDSSDKDSSADDDDDDDDYYDDDYDDDDDDDDDDL